MRQSIALVFVPLAAALLFVAFFAFGRSAEPRSPSPAPHPAALEDSTLEKATFAGGCFWCVESAFQDLDGVEAAVSGFSGGTQPDPTYDEVSSGQTDHVESVQLAYDPGVISYEELLDVYWRQIDPTDDEGQFADRGAHYRPVIFYHDERQQKLAEQSKRALAESGPFDEPIAVTIEPYTDFYAAEEYHQDYYKKNPERYKRYYEGSGRGPFLRRTWGDQKKTSASASKSSLEEQQAAWRSFEKPAQETLKEQLSPMQYRVTQQNGTEPAFENAYWDNKKAGIYVDVVSGEPLFSSTHKFDSGTGWPSFYKPLEPELIVEREDRSLGMVRTEVRSRQADSHLGHVFRWSGKPDVPTSLRYCINSAALRFIPKDRLEEEGYGEYAALLAEGAQTADADPR